MSDIIETQWREAREKLAGRMYDRYCKAMGGKAFNGDTLPTWEVFAADPANQVQAKAWIEAANVAIALLVEHHQGPPFIG